MQLLWKETEGYGQVIFKYYPICKLILEAQKSGTEK